MHSAWSRVNKCTIQPPPCATLTKCFHTSVSELASRPACFISLRAQMSTCTWSTGCTLNVNTIHILKLCSGLRVKAGYKREFGLTYSEFYNRLRSFQTLNYYSVSITDEMAAKQKLTEEFDSASNAVLTKSAIIHGVVASALPMKTGKRAKFFEGKLTDGTKMMRMVGFRSHQQKQLATYHADAKPVALHNCELKPARQSQELEVLIKSSTRIESSPKFVTSTTSCRRILL